MAQTRNPRSGQWAEGSPPGAAESTPPKTPDPGPLSGPSAIDSFSFTPTRSTIQSLLDLSAVSSPPAMAGPCPVMPTTPMQDLADTPFAGDSDPSGQPS